MEGFLDTVQAFAKVNHGKLDWGITRFHSFHNKFDFPVLRHGFPNIPTSNYQQPEFPTAYPTRKQHIIHEVATAAATFQHSVLLCQPESLTFMAVAKKNTPCQLTSNPHAGPPSPPHPPPECPAKSMFMWVLCQPAVEQVTRSKAP